MHFLVKSIGEGRKTYARPFFIYFFDQKRKGTRIKPWGAPRFEKGVF